MDMKPKGERGRRVRILGTHGVPAAYGGFETAAENVARYLRDHGWEVTVYCQIKGKGSFAEDEWNGIHRVLIGVDREGWLGTATFDLLSIKHALRTRELCLTFGYNTALFNIAQRLLGVPNVINMDGIEWSRARWGKMRQGILYANERIGAKAGNVLIADHPEIEKYLLRRAPARKIEMITYGADRVDGADVTACSELDIEPNKYFSLIARPIPENSILEIVQGFSARFRGVKLVILGNYDAESDPYHRQVLDAASEEVVFAGAIYEAERVRAIRFHSLGYLHGHTVGGTNPSLVEALGAGNPVIAHDNPYNRWVAGDAGLFFRDVADIDKCVSRFLEDEALVRELGAAAYSRHKEEFTWEYVASRYEDVLLRFC